MCSYFSYLCSLCDLFDAFIPGCSQRCHYVLRVRNCVKGFDWRKRLILIRITEECTVFVCCSFCRMHIFLLVLLSRNTTSFSCCSLPLFTHYAYTIRDEQVRELLEMAANSFSKPFLLFQHVHVLVDSLLVLLVGCSWLCQEGNVSRSPREEW